jgi:hypothetical protein
MTDTMTDRIKGNTSTKADLLTRAKAAIEAGDRSLREAAEVLAIAQELHDASQVEMARAVGKSETWVSRLLRWRRLGYRDESPFGPRTKAGRLAHAQDWGSPSASKPRKSLNPKPAGNSRDIRRLEGMDQLKNCIEQVMQIVSALHYDDRDRRMLRQQHEPFLDGFIDEKGKRRLDPSSRFGVIETSATGNSECNDISPEKSAETRKAVNATLDDEHEKVAA